MTMTTDALHRTVQYLIRVCDSIDDEKHDYLIDWDLLQEAIYPDKSSSVYSSLVWCALECLESSSRGETWKPMLPEGTRRELLNHVAHLTTNLSNDPIYVQGHTSGDRNATERLLGTLPLEWNRPDWKEVLAHIQRLYRANEAVHLLLLLISRYTRPCPVLNPGDFALERESYERRLIRYRHKVTNSADADNLASAALLSPPSISGAGRLSATLVSGSRTVWQAGEARTADPFFFMVDAYYRRYQPNPQVRKKQLRSLISDLYKLLADTDHHPEPTKENLLREETSEFLMSLDALDNVALQELGRLLSTAAQAVENAKIQAKNLGIESIDAGLGGLGSLAALKRKAQIVRDSISPYDTSELEWHEVFSSPDAKRHRLHAGGSDLLELQLAEEEMTLSWHTRILLSIFIETFKAFVARGTFPQEWLLSVRLPNIPGVATKMIQASELSLSDVIGLSGGRKIAFIRLDAAAATFWYLLINHAKLTHGHSSNHHARVAIRLSLALDLNGAIQMFDETAYNWYFPAAVETKVRERIEGPNFPQELTCRMTR